MCTPTVPETPQGPVFATCGVCGIEVLVTLSFAEAVESASPLDCLEWHGGDPYSRVLAEAALLGEG